MRHTRIKASLAACVAAIGCMAMDDATRGDREDAAPDEAVAAMRQRVREEAHALRASLDAAEAGRDWSELLERKRSVDAWLAPMHVVRDALRAAAPGAACDLLAAWRVEWRDGPVREEWSHPDGAELAKRALDAWIPRPGSGEAVRIEATTSGERWVGCDAPTTCAWTVDGSWGGDGPVVHGRCWWRFPLAEPVRIDLPLSGDGMDLWWNDRGARYQDDRGASHEERWPVRPLFCNPPGMFAAFDSLRGAAAPDARCEAGPCTGDAVHPPDDPPVKGTTRRTRRVLAGDGRLLRTDEWNWIDGRLERIELRMEPLRMVHHAERAVRMSTEVEGDVVDGGEHRAASEVEEFAGGASAVIAFRHAVPGTDAVRDVPAASVPATGRFTVGGRVIASFATRSVRLGMADLLDAHACGALAALGKASSAHRALAQRIADAIASHDATALESATRSVRAMHASAGMPAWAAEDERTLLLARVTAAGMAVPACLGSVGDFDGRAGGRGSRASVIPCESDGPHEAPMLAKEPPVPAGESWPGTDACDCGGDAERRLCRAAEDALRSAGLRDGWAACVRGAMCARSREDSARVMALDDATAHRIATDLAGAIRAGAVALDDGPDAEACMTLAGAIAEVARRPLPDPEDHARRVIAIDAACEGARRALRDALRTSGVRGAFAEDGAARIFGEFDALARRRRALAGNAFVEPVIDPDAPPVDPAACLARAAGDGRVADAVEREAERVDALHRAAGPAIGAARERSAHARIAAAAMRAVERALG